MSFLFMHQRRQSLDFNLLRSQKWPKKQEFPLNPEIFFGRFLSLFRFTKLSLKKERIYPTNNPAEKDYKKIQNFTDFNLKFKNLIDKSEI